MAKKKIIKMTRENYDKLLATSSMLMKMTHNDYDDYWIKKDLRELSAVLMDICWQTSMTNFCGMKKEEAKNETI